MTRLEAKKYQRTIDDHMDSERDKIWLAACVNDRSDRMAYDHCEMIQNTLTHGKGAGYEMYILSLKQ